MLRNLDWMYPKLEEAGDGGVGGGGGAAAPDAGAPAAGEDTQKPGGEPVAPAAGEGEPSGGEPKTPAGEGEAPSTPAAGAKVDKRFSELSAARKQAERERDEANKRLGQALEAVERLTGKPAATAEKKLDEEDPEPQAPQFQDPEQFQRDSTKYTRELVDWTSRRAVKAALAEQESKRVTETQAQTNARINAEWRKRREAAIQSLPDYEEVAEAQDLPITDVMAGAITVDPEGAHVAYYLGQNRAEAERIAALSPGQQLVEFGVLKAKVIAERASKTVTRTPPPIKPTGGAPSTTKPLAELPMDEYAKRREAEIAASRRPGAR